MSKRLILESDDFGITPAVSQTILELITNHSITSTNLMVDMPESAETVRAALTAGISHMGIHLILDRHRALTPDDKIKSLIDPTTGKLWRFEQLQKRAVAHLIDLGEARLEFLAQVQFAQRLGMNIDHITTHHGLTLFGPEWLQLIADLAD